MGVRAFCRQNGFAALKSVEMIAVDCRGNVVASNVSKQIVLNRDIEMEIVIH